MKQRLILSLLVIAALVYMALPRLPVHGSVLQESFVLAWLGFALLAFGGNLSALLFKAGSDRGGRHPASKRKAPERVFERHTGS
ncbi:MAG TPA: hypothetical protein VFK44_05300 [Bacillales bacterium]|nr:hypothetical protein [Bacillales bacterium]